MCVFRARNSYKYDWLILFKKSPIHMDKNFIDYFN